MELDLDVGFDSFPQASTLELQKILPVEFARTNASCRDVVVRAAPEPRTVASVDAAIQEFLNILKMHAEAVRQSQGILHLGIFYDLRETVVFPLRLSVETVKALAELNLEVDATGYPCADESDD